MKHLSTLLFCAIVATTAGCASSGNGTVATLTQDRAATMLVQGQTRASDVRRELGDAIVTEFPSGYSVWVYQFTDSAAKFVKYVPLLGRMTSTGTQVRELKILFDKDGVVKKYRLQEIHLQ